MDIARTQVVGRLDRNGGTAKDCECVCAGGGGGGHGSEHHEWI